MVANRQAMHSNSVARTFRGTEPSVPARVRERGRLRATAVCAGIALLETAGSVAFAQDAPSSAALPESQVAAPASEAQQSLPQLETVIVTARRRLENAQETPVVITTFTADRLDRLAVTSMEELGAAMPGLIVTRGHSGSGADFRLRGIGTTFSSIGMEQSVAVIVDGVYYGQQRLIDEGFEDLNRIEILKGPQALFFGKNSTAGVVSIVSEDPGSEFELKVRAGYELKSRESKGLFIISGPVSDTIGLRLAVSGRDMTGGYVRNDAPAATYTTIDAVTGISTPHAVPAPGDRDLPRDRSLFARFTATYSPASDLKLALKATASTHRSGAQTWNDRRGMCPENTSTIDPPEACGKDFVVEMNPVPADIAATRPDLDRYGGQPYALYGSNGVTARADYTGESLLLTSITNLQSYRFSSASDYDFTASPAIYTDQNNNQRAFSQELRAQTQLRAPVNYMLGLYYQRSKLNFAQASMILGSEDSAAAPFYRYVTLAKLSATQGDTRAIYGQVFWAALPGIEVAAGARYTDETKNSFFVQPYVNPFYTGIYALDHRLDSDQHFRNLSPEATLTWKPAADLMTYGAWKQGYKSGGFSNGGIDSVLGSSVDTFAFKPETVRGAEAGIKATLLDQRLHLNVAAYGYKYSDLQLEFFNAPTIALVSSNIGSATTKGIEFDGEYLPRGARGLRLRGAVQYNVARYQDFVGPCYVGQTQAAGCDQVGPPPANALLQNLSGKRLAGAPKWTGTLGFDHDRTLSNGMMFGVSAAATFSSSYSVSPVGQPLAVQAAYTRLDAALRLQSRDRQIQWALIGKNLTNRFVASYASDAPFSGSPAGGATGTLADQTVVFLPPRTIELQFSWRQ